MFIQTQETPNPNTYKFLPGREVMPGSTLNFRSPAQAARSPMAAELMALEGVVGVFYGEDFISVSKSDEFAWESLKPHVLGIIMENFVKNTPLLVEVGAEAKARPMAPGPNDRLDESADLPDFNKEQDEETQAIVGEIKELLESRVRPAVAQDGGDITFYGYEDGVVYLQMQGACSGCPSASVTLKNGIENMLKHYVPEVQEVRAVEGD